MMKGEKPPECYDFSGIRDFLKKYKSPAPKSQYDHRKNHMAKPSDDLLKAREAKFKRQDSKNGMKVVEKEGQNGNNGAELEPNEDEREDDQFTNCLLRAIILLIDSSKRKKISSKVSATELHDKHASQRLTPLKGPLRVISLDTNLPSVSGRSSPSLKRRNCKEYFMGVEDSFCRAPSMKRTTSKASSRLAGFEDKSSNGSPMSRNWSMGMTKSGQIIMFSSSSGMLKPPPIEKKLECTLEELCHGCVKHIKVTRGVFKCTGQRIQQEEVLTVTVKPGWIAGTKITFQGSTNEDNSEGYLADVVFTIIEKRHPLFRRIEDDLELEIEIPLADALTSCPLTIPLLGNEKLNMEIDEVVYPGYEITIVGQGMPNQRNPDYRGHLKVKCLVNFPTELNDEQRSQVFRILNG